MTDAFASADGANRTANMIRQGHVVEVDAATGTARVEFEEGWVSDDLPWMSGAAGALRIWSVPSVGEQVTVLSPSGETALGLVLRGQASTDFPGAGDNADLTRLEWNDGARIDYDAAGHALDVTLPSGGAIKLAVNGQSSVEIVEDRISLKVGGTELRIEDGQILIDGDIRLGGNGGKAIARHGDDVVANKIVATSTTVKAV